MSLYMRTRRRTAEGWRTASGLSWHCVRILVECGLDYVYVLYGITLRVWRGCAVWVVGDAGARRL